MDQEQARSHLETATCSIDHLLAKYAEKPHTAPDSEWLKLIVAHSRELVRAASDYLESDHASQPAVRT
jgi:hypothetical protein